GFQKKTVQCPNCKNLMRRNTLIRNTTCSLEEYANWLFWTGKYDADHRVKWENIFKVLKERGISYEFWGLYKKVKEDYWAKHPAISVDMQQSEYSNDLT